MQARQYALGLLAVLAVLAAATGQARSGQWGLDLDLGQERTSIILTAAAIRLAFEFEHGRSKTNSMRLEIA
ncbi:MAG TPA: hypothetical protein VGE65_01885 [Sphingobium sp.]